MTDAKPYSVDFDSPVAVYAQIANQILFDVASGRLKAGDRAPSGRDLADLLEVNPNTVMKAYRDLELVGVVDSRRGLGVTITEKGPKIAFERAVAMVTARLRESVAECLAVGMKASAIRALAAEAVASGCRPYSPKP